MRLIRIRALSEDVEMPDDIRKVFENILPDEEFHAKAFAAMSTEEAIESTGKLHDMGLEMLGLEI
jgi:rubrerythrin